MDVTIAIDCMGGDNGPSVTLPAVFHFLQSDIQAGVILVGLPGEVEAAVLKEKARFGNRLRFQAASEVVGMHDPIATALRIKKDSSMRVAVNLVKSGEAQAAVSAGNTGALMAISRFVLKTLPGIDRPAIAFALPTLKGHTYVLDLGANVDCEPQHLLQFGIMAAMLVSAVEHNDREQGKPNSIARTGFSHGLSLPTAHQGLKVHFTRGLPARYVPPSGFGYPRDGLLPSNPCRFCFTPAALMGLSLRSFLLPTGIRALLLRKDPRTVCLLEETCRQGDTPDRRAAVSGLRP